MFSTQCMRIYIYTHGEVSFVRNISILKRKSKTKAKILPTHLTVQSLDQVMNLACDDEEDDDGKSSVDPLGTYIAPKHVREWAWYKVRIPPFVFKN